jgi:acetoin utilization deacetylase AcuC-like enzyme
LTTILYSHDDCLGHDTGAGHPERPARLEAVERALGQAEFADLERRDAPTGERDQITRVHAPAFVDHVFAAMPSQGLAFLDPDTVASPGSAAAALRGVGAICAAVDAVAEGEANNAFCAVRPPGHHAEPDRAMGFCLFNSVAIAAGHARHVHGIERIAVVDFDVHHGNGTQAAFWADADLMYASTHQYPFYPGTGGADERGEDGQGNIVNAPLDAGAGSTEFRQAMSRRIIPALINFAPQLLIISAGFDGHAEDPLAQLNLVDDDYLWVTGELMSVADQTAGGRIVSTLEGGYDLAALGRSVAAHVRTLMTA